LNDAHRNIVSSTSEPVSGVLRLLNKQVAQQVVALVKRVVPGKDAGVEAAYVLPEHVVTAVVPARPIKVEDETDVPVGFYVLGMQGFKILLLGTPQRIG
jgi:hypothetical protein